MYRKEIHYGDAEKKLDSHVRIHFLPLWGLGEKADTQSGRAPVLETADEVRAYFRGLRDNNSSEQLLIRRRLTTETPIKTSGSPSTGL